MTRTLHATDRLSRAAIDAVGRRLPPDEPLRALPGPGTPPPSLASTVAGGTLEGTTWLLGLVVACVVAAGLAAGVLLAVAKATERVSVDVTVFDLR